MISTTVEPDLKEQLKQHLSARLTYFQQCGLDISALFFNQSLDALQSKLQSFSLLDLYVLKARTEEVDKMLTQGLLAKYEKQRQALQQQQDRLGAVAQRFRDCAVRYSQGSGLSLNLAAYAFPPPPAIIPTSATTTATDASSLSTNATTVTTMEMTSSATGVSGSGGSKSQASERPYNPLDPDGSSDMSLCSPVRDPYQSHHHRPQQEQVTLQSNNNIATESTSMSNNNLAANRNGIGTSLTGIAASLTANGGGVQLAAQSDSHRANGAGLATVSDQGAPSKRQTRMRDVVQGLIEENEKIFTEFALLYLEQEKAYNTLLVHCQRVESDLAQARHELAQANEQARKTSIDATSLPAVSSIAVATTNATPSNNNSDNSKTSSNLFVDVAKSALAMAFGEDEAMAARDQHEKVIAINTDEMEVELKL